MDLAVAQIRTASYSIRGLAGALATLGVRRSALALLFATASISLCQTVIVNFASTKARCQLRIQARSENLSKVEVELVESVVLRRMWK